jgi:hypothetical protein
VVTATVAVPEAPVSRGTAWEVAWADAAREAARLGADPATAEALARGAGTAIAGGTRVVVAAHGEVVLAWWLPAGAGASSVLVGPLPHLLEVADAAARRPACVVLLPTGTGPISSRTRPATRFRAAGSSPGTVPACSPILIRAGRPRCTMASGT